MTTLQVAILCVTVFLCVCVLAESWKAAARIQQGLVD